MLDIIYTIDNKFKGFAPPAPFWISDVNSDGAYDILDIIHMIDNKFKEGPLPDCTN
jgi:hypothetical protein